MARSPTLVIRPKHPHPRPSFPDYTAPPPRASGVSARYRTRESRYTTSPHRCLAIVEETPPLGPSLAISREGDIETDFPGLVKHRRHHHLRVKHPDIPIHLPELEKHGPHDGCSGLGALQRHAQEIRHQRHFPLHGLPEHFSARLVFPASFLVVDLGHAVARRAVQSRVTAQEPAPHPPVVQGWVERAPRTRRCRGPRRRCPRVPGSARRAASPPWLRMCSRSPRPSARGIAGPRRWPPGRTDKHPSRAWSPSRRPSCYTRMHRSTGCGWCRCRRETRPSVG